METGNAVNKDFFFFEEPIITRWPLNSGTTESLPSQSFLGCRRQSTQSGQAGKE